MSDRESRMQSEPSIDMFSAVEEMPENLQRLVAFVTDTDDGGDTEELWLRQVPPTTSGK